MAFRLLCKLGLHEWDKWESLSSNSCTQVMVCKYDGVRSTLKSLSRITHLWGKWEYESEGNCVQKRKCTRDSVVETKVSHELGEWMTDEDGMKTRSCKRCQQKFQFIWSFNTRSPVDFYNESWNYGIEKHYNYKVAMEAWEYISKGGMIEATSPLCCSYCESPFTCNECKAEFNAPQIPETI